LDEGRCAYDASPFDFNEYSLMPHAKVFRTSGFQGVPLTPLSRVKFNGLNITQAVISEITYLVRRLNQGNPIEVSGPIQLIPSLVVFDPDQFGNLPGSSENPDPRWTRDTIGFNFAPTIEPNDFPVGDDEYWIAFAFTPTSGYPFVQIVRAVIISNLGAFGP
jgi:hypothetical protein